MTSGEEDKDDGNDGHSLLGQQEQCAASLVAPSLFWIHLSALSAQSVFGGGAIVGELGLSATNPVWFAALREGVSGPILCAVALWKDGATPSLSDWRLFIGPGVHLFVNQFCYIIGLKVSSGITASAWMPSQGILAVLYGLCLGVEGHVDCYKTSGIVIGSASALLMILFEERSDADSDAVSSLSILGGSAMFFLSCSGTVFYLISSKRALQKYPPSTVTGYCYLVTTVLMAAAAVIVAASPSLLDAVCPDCDGNAWRVPMDSLYALRYDANNNADLRRKCAIVT